MRTKNFFKGLAVAAVALVGVFATSCSEEELNLNGTINGSPVDPVTPTELPDGVAYAAISVVDLGDLGLGSQVLTTEMKDVTALDGTEIECPDFDGMEDYVIPAAQKISVPTLQKGQSVTIPMTFYVVKTTSAFAHVEWDINNPKSWGNTEEGTPYVYSEETWKGTEEEDLQNLSNYWKDIQVRYSVPYAYFVEVLGETEAPEGGEGEEPGEGEGEEPGEGEGEGEGEATEGEVVLSFDFEDGQANFFSWNLTSVEAAEGACKAVVPEADASYNAQLAYDVTTPFTLDQEYKVVFKVKGSAEGKADLVFQTPSQDLGWPVAGSFGEFNITTDWTDVELTTTCTRDDATRLIFSFGTMFVGDLYIDDFQLIAVAPAAKAAATTAEEIVAAYVKNIVMPEHGVEETTTLTAGPVTLFSGGCVDFTKTVYSNKPTYVFTYMGEEVEVQFEQIISAWGVLGTPYAIPGHETEYTHSEGHGHYQHDQHGNDMNAGGGIVSFE